MNNTYQSFVLEEPFGIDGMRQVQREARPLNGREVRIAVEAVSLNYRDLILVEGRWKKPRSGMIPVSDAAGRVIEVGPLVTRFRLGDRVSANLILDWIDGPITDDNSSRTRASGSIDGMLTQEQIVEEPELVLIPDSLSFIEAATLPCAALAAWNALCEQITIGAGDKILLQGTGGVSMFAAQFAEVRGSEVIFLTRSAAKVQKLKTRGYEMVVNTTDRPDWDVAVREMTHGQGVDVMLEARGGNIDKSLLACRPAGALTLLGQFESTSVDFSVFTMRNITIREISVGSRSMFERMNAFIEAHKLSPTIDEVFSFDDAPKAFSYLKGGRHLGKVVISLS